MAPVCNSSRRWLTQELSQGPGQPGLHSKYEEQKFKVMFRHREFGASLVYILEVGQGCTVIPCVKQNRAGCRSVGGHFPKMCGLRKMPWVQFSEAQKRKIRAHTAGVNYRPACFALCLRKPHTSAIRSNLCSDRRN